MRLFAEEYRQKMRHIDRDRAEDELAGTQTDTAASETEIAKLVRQLGDSDSGVQALAERLFIMIGEPAVDTLLEATGSEESQVRWRAAYALSMIGDKRAYASILELVLNAEKGSEEHYEAVLALGRLGDAQAVEPLISILNQAKFGESLGQWAATALVELGQASLPACGRSQRKGRRKLVNLPVRPFDNSLNRKTEDRTLEKTTRNRRGRVHWKQLCEALVWEAS